MPQEGTVTRAVNALGREGASSDDYFPIVYIELRRLANRQLAKEWRNHEFQTTQIVNEALVRLMDGRPENWQNRAHFYGAAARAIRQILVDAARRRRVRERHLMLARPPEGDRPPGGAAHVDMLALDAALAELERIEPILAQVVSLRFFAGLTVKRIAEVTGLGDRTVKRHWNFARAWLYRRMNECGDPVPREQ